MRETTMKLEKVETVKQGVVVLSERELRLLAGVVNHASANDITDGDIEAGVTNDELADLYASLSATLKSVEQAR
jgi:hypothetical protein